VAIEPPTNAEPVNAEPSAADLVEAGTFLAEREVYGLVWINRDLVVRAKFGPKADFVALDQPIADSVTPFIGAEPYILTFQDDPTLSLELPGVVIHTSAEHQGRYNLSLFWSARHQHYMLLIARASIDASLEIELLRNVRARLMAEKQTQAKSEQLARANRDLESFASIISHDLKAPMRALCHVADETLATLSAGNLDAACSQLEWMRAQSRRMSAMLSGLLQYSTIGRKVEAIETVDTLALVQAIRDSVSWQGQKVVTVHGVWPVIETLKSQLEVVLRNLVDNAIKHHDRDHAIISLTCDERPDHLKITVADDGPGIVPAHREAIFLPFRTLAAPGTTAPQDGIGLGLALVKRTLESVGGGIRLRSDPEQARGTTFEITWPRTIQS